jgi:hypothetical protein
MRGYQRTPLPPQVFIPPIDSSSGGNDIDAVTGMTIPVGREIEIDGVMRDSRYPYRIDKPGFPLDLISGEGFERDK